MILTRAVGGVDGRASEIRLQPTARLLARLRSSQRLLHDKGTLSATPPECHSPQRRKNVVKLARGAASWITAAGCSTIYLTPQIKEATRC